MPLRFTPRVHPTPGSPKGKDLQRDGRYTLHCSVADSNGGEGEFYVRGLASLSDDPELRAQAVRAAPYVPQDRYILFVLAIEFAFMNTYVDNQANPRHWQY